MHHRQRVGGGLLNINLNVGLTGTSLITGVLLAVTFAARYRPEGTLPIHSIVTRRREACYWPAILVTFALGTASGDLMAEVLGLGLGATVTSAIFTVGILAIVAYPAISHADVADGAHTPHRSGTERHGLPQTLVTAALIAAPGGVGYVVRTLGRCVDPARRRRRRHRRIAAVRAGSMNRIRHRGCGGHGFR